VKQTKIIGMTLTVQTIRELKILTRTRKRNTSSLLEVSSEHRFRSVIKKIGLKKSLRPSCLEKNTLKRRPNHSSKGKKERGQRGEVARQESLKIGLRKENGKIMFLGC